jgi:hypothetical protein
MIFIVIGIALLVVSTVVVIGLGAAAKHADDEQAELTRRAAKNDEQTAKDNSKPHQPHVLSKEPTDQP